MTKADMAAKLASSCDLSKAKAEEIIDSIFSTKPGEGILATELDAGNKVQVTCLFRGRDDPNRRDHCGSVQGSKGSQGPCR